MRQQQMTNEADGESVRATADEHGQITVEVCPCDDDGHPLAWASWSAIAIRELDGSTDYLDDDWTEARTATVNDVLRLL